MGTVPVVIVSRRDHILTALDKLPPFSPVITRVLATLGDENVSIGELAGIIETDTVLAGNILRVVNSPLYGRSASINSVRHAVAIVGMVKVRNLVLGLSVSRRLAGAVVPRSWDAKRFNLHSAAVAVLSDLLVLDLEVPYAEGAFTAGLLHDIGKLLIAISMPEEFEKICNRTPTREVSLDSEELVMLGTTHAEVSGLVLAKWNLPKPIQQAARYHHSPQDADGGHLHLAHVIDAADAYISENGLGMAPYSQQPRICAAQKDFGLRDMIPSLAESFQNELEAVRTFF